MQCKGLFAQGVTSTVTNRITQNKANKHKERCLQCNNISTVFLLLLPFLGLESSAVLEYDKEAPCGLGMLYSYEGCFS